MAVIEGLGSVAGNFMEGYRQARTQKNQESLAKQQLNYEHANRLFQMADQVQDPKMKDTLFSSATRLLESLESPTAEKKNPKGIGAMFGNLFGIGHHRDTPAPSIRETPMGPAQPPKIAAPDAVSDDSNTFGNLGDMFGSTLQAKPAAAAAAPAGPPQIPPVPNVDLSQSPTTKEIVAASFPFQPPSLTSPRGTPVTAPIAQQMAPVAPAAPRRQAEPMSLPVASAVIAHAKAEAEKQFPDPMHQYQRQAAVSKMARETAGEMARRLLSVTDQHLQGNPNIRTAMDAARDPEWGMDFKNVMDTLATYEAQGLIDKGTLDRWQSQRFQELGKWDPTQTQTLADGRVVQINPANNRYDIPVGDAKAAPAQTFDQTVDAAFATPETRRTPEQLAAIAGFLEKKSKGDRSTMSPTDQVQFDWLKANETMPIASKAQKFQSLFHPVQPSVATLPGVNPATGKTVIYIRRGDKMEPTEIQTPGPTFIPERYQTKGTMTRKNEFNKDEAVETNFFDAGKLIAGHSSGDVTLDTLTNLLNSGAEFSPQDKIKLQNYVASRANPYSTPR